MVLSKEALLFSMSMFVELTMPNDFGVLGILATNLAVMEPPPTLTTEAPTVQKSEAPSRKAFGPRDLDMGQAGKQG